MCIHMHICIYMYIYAYLIIFIYPPECNQAAAAGGLRKFDSSDLYDQSVGRSAGRTLVGGGSVGRSVGRSVRDA